MMMVVVPAFAQGDQREPEVVAALVAGVVTLGAEQMRQGIDARRGMKQHGGAKDETPNEELQSGHAEGRYRMLEPKTAKIYQ